MTGRWPFRRQLKRIDRKHRGATRAIETLLQEIAANGMPPNAMRLPGIGGSPVFKVRVRVGHHGKQSCRLILHYESGVATPLLIYMKSDTEDVSPTEVINALRTAGIIGRRPPKRQISN